MFVKMIMFVTLIVIFITMIMFSILIIDHVQHSLPGTRETQTEESRHPGHGETSEAVAPQTSTQPLPHQGRETPAGCGLKYDSSSGEVRVRGGGI